MPFIYDAVGLGGQINNNQKQTWQTGMDFPSPSLTTLLFSIHGLALATFPERNSSIFRLMLLTLHAVYLLPIDAQML